MNSCKERVSSSITARERVYGIRSRDSEVHILRIRVLILMSRIVMAGLQYGQANSWCLKGLMR